MTEDQTIAIKNQGKSDYLKDEVIDKDIDEDEIKTQLGLNRYKLLES